MRIKQLFISVVVITATIFGLSSCGGESGTVSGMPSYEDVQEELEAVIRAPYSGDLELILKHTHSKVIKVSGGQKNFEIAINELIVAVKSESLKISSLSIGEPHNYLVTKKYEFFLVDTVVDIDVDGEIMLGKPRMLAVKEIGSEIWAYIDTEGLNDKLLKQWFPNLPDAFSVHNKAE